MQNCIADFASDLANVDIVRFKTVICMLLVKTMIFLIFSIIPEKIRWLVLPIHQNLSFYPSSPSSMVSSLFSYSSDTNRLSFVSIPTLSPQRPGKTLWVVWDSHTLFPSFDFVTASATPVLGIFTSCSGYPLSVYV